MASTEMLLRGKDGEETGVKSKRARSFRADEKAKRRKKNNECCTGRQESTTTGFVSDELYGMQFLVRAAWWRMCGLVSLLVLGFGALIAMITLVESGSYLAWVLVSAYGALAWALKTMYTQMVHFVESACNVSLHVRGKSKNKYLIQALAETLEKLAIRSEAEVEVEKGEEEMTGAAVYKLLLLPNSLKCSVRISKGEKSHEVEICSLHSDAVACGPRQEMHYPTEFHVYCRVASMFFFLSLPFRANSGMEILRLASRQHEVLSFLQAWLADMYADYMRASVGMVEVLQLEKESTEWGPEWHAIRKERAVNRGMSASGSPSAYYSVQSWATKMLKHAEFAVQHKGRNRTSLFLHGAKGSGKTLFVEWLASELGLPIYYIDLRADFINDSVLRDAITSKKLHHNLPVIFHVDEFQSIMEAWTEHKDHSTEVPNSTKITIQGLQSVLEGIATPNHALFVFTGSCALPSLGEMTNQPLRHEWEGLLRRLPVRETIPLVGEDVVANFYIEYLTPYLPQGADVSGIERKCEDLIDKWDLHRTSVPFDMLTKYAEQQLRTAYVQGILVAEGSGMRMCVHAGKTEDFLALFFQAEALSTWSSTYAGGAHARVDVQQ